MTSQAFGHRKGLYSTSGQTHLVHFALSSPHLLVPDSPAAAVTSISCMLPNHPPAQQYLKPNPSKQETEIVIILLVFSLHFLQTTDSEHLHCKINNPK